MGDREAQDWTRERWKSQMRPEYLSLLTSHLPTRLVEQDVSIAVGQFTDPEDPRGAIVMTGVALDGRVNETWSPDEAEYIVATLLASARRIWQKYGDDRPVPDVPT